MKVLLCSPYNQGPNIAQGGISVWAQNIVSYYQSNSGDVELHVVSYDRKTYVEGRVGMLKRAWLGLKEYRSAIKETRSQLKTREYAVMHLCTSASISLLKDLLVLRMVKRYGTKSAIHFHFGRIPDLAQGKNWEWKLLKQVVKLADVAITMDMRSYNTLAEHGFKNVKYLPNPLSLAIMKQIAEEKDDVMRISNKLLFVGHVIPTKGVYELVDACKQIPDVELHVIGKVLPDVKEEIILRSGNGEWLQFRGEMPHEEVIKEMLSAQVFVLPTYTEGFPNVILESMACGCAIVTTPVGAIPEMLDLDGDSPCGLCAEPRNVDALKKNIVSCLNDKSFAELLGKRAVKRVNEMYAVPEVWKQLHEIWVYANKKELS